MIKHSTFQRSYLAPGEVAKLLMVSPATIRHWASKGELVSVSTPGGHRRFMRHEVERFARNNNLTVQLPDSDSLRILIVDDDMYVASFLSRFFDSLDADVDTKVANDGFTAGRVVQDYRPHVVLLDLMMPGLNGFEVCAQIKNDAALKAIRVIAMTGFFDEENVRLAVAAGAECCIAKPFDEDQLLTLLGLQGSRKMSRITDVEAM